MFKIPGKLPIITSPVEELTDFIEWQCIKNNDISIIDAMKPLRYASDEIQVTGVNDESDDIIALYDDVSIEMTRRKIACDNLYPFYMYKNGYRVGINNYHQSFWVYTYLLLSTRVNMRDNKTARNIDGTKILEELSALVVKNYFGKHARSKVFGTAQVGSFPEKVNEICQLTGEGHSFLSRDHLTISAQDDKLDVVVWNEFADKKKSKLLGFGQCKTGTTWDDASTIELQPEDFCAKWWRDMPIATPVKLFFSSQYFPLESYSKAKNAGIVFDRFRILSLLPTLDIETLEKIKLWTKSTIHLFRKS